MKYKIPKENVPDTIEKLAKLKTYSLRLNRSYPIEKHTASFQLYTILLINPKPLHAHLMLFRNINIHTHPYSFPFSIAFINIPIHKHQ